MSRYNRYSPEGERELIRVYSGRGVKTAKAGGHKATPLQKAGGHKATPLQKAGASVAPLQDNTGKKGKSVESS